MVANSVNYSALIIFCFSLLFSKVEAQEISPMGSINFSVQMHRSDRQQIDVKYDFGAFNEVLVSEQIALPGLTKAPFQSLSLKTKKTTAGVAQLYFIELDEKGELIRLSMDTHETDISEGQGFILPFYIPDSCKSFRLFALSNAKFEESGTSLICHLFNPGNSEEPEHISSIPITLREEPCDQPEYLDRAAWCSTCPEDSTPEYTIPTHMIIHHSAGTNTSSDWAAVVRSIWDYHVNVRGWDDIGYNWLIDPNGVLYEGRGNDRQGAHFCGYNTETMGCCMMGTYTSIKPGDAAIETLIGLMAWKCFELNFDPTETAHHNSSGLDLKRVSGHRDGCSTECPGTSFYNDFDNLLGEIKSYMGTECSDNPISEVQVIFGPNPNYGFFTIQNPFKETLKMEIFSMDGKKVTNTIDIGSESGQFFHFPHLPAGIYILLLDGTAIHWKTKFIVL